MEPIPLSFQGVSFAWEDEPVLKNVHVDIPTGMTSLVGPNGAGKSTFLYLATGRVTPKSGTILLFGHDTTDLTETERNVLASMLYQNMEFDHEEALGDLLGMVEDSGSLRGKGAMQPVVQAMELDHLLQRPASKLSKGETQRAVLAFSLLYGSRLMALDEPVFAMEDQQRSFCLGFVRDFAKTHRITILASLHELELSRDFFDALLLVPSKGQLEWGPVDRLYTREKLEDLFQAPWASLKTRETFYRLGLEPGGSRLSK